MGSNPTGVTTENWSVALVASEQFFADPKRDENAGANEGERGGVDGLANRREPVTESHWGHQEISAGPLVLT